MGLPGLYRCLLKILPKCIQYYVPYFKGNVHVLIDGNIILYMVKDKLRNTSSSLIEANMVIEFLKELANHIEQKTQSSRYIITFDGLPPFAKLPEQIRRRIVNIPEIVNENFFDISNDLYIEFLKDLESHIKSELGWVVIGYDTEGEGEQKIANYVKEHVPKKDTTVFVSKDWDMLLIATGLWRYRSVAKCYIWMLMNLEPRKNPFISVHTLCNNIDAVHFSAVVLLFGCDFFPGIGNLPREASYVKKLMDLDPWIRFTKNNTLKISVSRFRRALDKLDTMTKKSLVKHNLRNQHKNQSNDLANGFISYSNIKSRAVSVEISCNEACHVCRPDKFLSQDLLQQNARDFMKMYQWTLDYFLNRHVTVKVSKISDTFYRSSYASTALSIKNILTDTVEFASTEIAIIKRSRYNKIMKNIRSYDYTVQMPCEFSPRYSDSPRLVMDLNLD